jgi:predicted phage-related endonuclease
VDGFEQDDNLAMYLGREMEPIIKKLFMERTGLKVLNDNKIRIDQEYDFLTTNLDGMVVGEGVPVEYKTSGMPWTGDIPEHYFVQIQHQMMVTESPSIYFVSLSMGLRKQLVVEKYDRNDEFISEMRSELVRFWHDHIITRTPPEPESLNDAKKRYTEIDPESVATATPDDQLIWATMNTLKEERKVIDEQIKDHQLSLIKKIGERESLVSLSGHTLVTWKRTKDSVVFDAQRFAKEKPDLYNKYMRTRSGYRRFILKEDIND